MNKLYYNVDKKVTVDRVVNVLLKYPDKNICMNSEDGIIVGYMDNDAITLDGMSYFYYIDDFETIEEYKAAFDNSLIYSDITAGHLAYILSNINNRYVSVIGSDDFSMYIDDKNIIFDCIMCENCFKNDIKVLKEAPEYEVYAI